MRPVSPGSPPPRAADPTPLAAGKRGGVRWRSRGFDLLVLAALAGSALYFVWQPTPTLLHLVLSVVFVGGLLGLSVRWGRAPGHTWAHHPEARSTAPAVPHFALFSSKGFVLAGDKLLQQARASGQSLCIGVLDVTDLPELHNVFGSGVAQQIVDHVSAQLRPLAGPKGLAVRTGPTEFSLLLPGVERDLALLSLRRAFGAACCIEYELGDDELVLVTEFEVASVPADAATISATYGELREKLARSQRPGTKPADTPRQPSGPAPLIAAPALAARMAQEQPRSAVYVTTVPMPLQ